MTDNVPMQTIRVDYALTAEDMANAVMNCYFSTGISGAYLVQGIIIRSVTSQNRKGIRDLVRAQLTMCGTSTTWREHVTDTWTPEERDETFQAVLVHVERVNPDLIEWVTRETHSPSGLKCEQYPFHDPRWARVSVENRDGTVEVITTTSNVDAAYREFGRRWQQYVDTYCDDEN